MAHIDNEEENIVNAVASQETDDVCPQQTLANPPAGTTTVDVVAIDPEISSQSVQDMDPNNIAALNPSDDLGQSAASAFNSNGSISTALTIDCTDQLAGGMLLSGLTDTQRDIVEALKRTGVSAVSPNGEFDQFAVSTFNSSAANLAWTTDTVDHIHGGNI